MVSANISANSWSSIPTTLSLDGTWMPSRRAAMIAPIATSSHTPTIAVGRWRVSLSRSAAAAAVYILATVALVRSDSRVWYVIAWIAIGFIWFFTLINLFGVRRAGGAQLVTLGLKLIPVIGAPVGAVVNWRLTTRLATTAMNAYRLRWFEDEHLT